MKKRVFAFILVITLALSFGTSLPAYAKYDKEILFRDIPWGCTAEEVIAYLSDMDIEWGDYYYAPYKDNTDIMINGAAKNPDYRTGCWIQSTDVNEKVAGYDLKSITLYFAFKDIDDKSVENTSFYMAINDFDLNNNETLKDTVISMYGNFDKFDTVGKPIIYNIWTKI